MANKCRECERDIAWTITRKGKNMPVDTGSLTDEDVELVRAGEPVNFRFGIHVSHFDTCPEADKFRKRKE